MEQETHTLQVWPSGHGYEYRGDPFADVAHPVGKIRGLRKHNYNGEPPERWRKGTSDEWAAITAEVRVARYIDQEILKCDSVLVDVLLKSEFEGFALEEVTNLYPDPDAWDADECREYFADHGIDEDRSIALDDVDRLREIVRDNAEPAEIFEWWAITSWLAKQLTAIGEPVLDNGHGFWWGRTCTGQAMKMDGTLQRIARRHT